MHTAEAGYLPSQFTEGSAKKKKKKKQLSHKQLAGEKKWQSLCFSLFIPSRKAGKGLRPIFIFRVGTG